jgi:HK97 family phage major capsid protein
LLFFASCWQGYHKVGGIIKASTEIIQDSQFDIASEIITEFGIAFEDKDETAFLFGDGNDFVITTGLCDFLFVAY